VHLWNGHPGPWHKSVLLLWEAKIHQYQPGHEAKQKCPVTNDKDGCCKTKYQSIKIKDNHVAADIVIAPAKYFSAHYFSRPSVEPTIIISQLRSFANASHAPPTQL
jgi:hypothetical protein